MKILFVTDLYPINNENIAKALYYIVQEWKRQGHEVEVIRSNFVLNSYIRGRKFYKTQVLLENGIKIYNLNYFTPFWFNVYHKLPKEFSLNNYDVIISHMPCGALLSSKLLKKNAIKYVCAVHSSDIQVLKNWKYAIYFKKRLKKAYLLADKIAARSPVLQTRIEELIPQIEDKTFVAYSGIREEIINENMAPKLFDEDNIRITTVASLIKRKNVDIIIKSLALLNNKKLKLVIIGDGYQRRNLEKLVDKKKLRNQVVFLGKLSREEVLANLVKSDIFVLLSDNETFGLAYLEAMLTENIVIAKKNDGIDGILQNGQNSFLIDSNVDELVKCLRKILAMKDVEIELIKSEAVKTMKQLTLESAAESYIRNIQ